MISTITSTQVYKQIKPIVRNHDTCIYRLRNHGDLYIIPMICILLKRRVQFVIKQHLLQMYHET